jgi:hypothetical protein
MAMLNSVSPPNQTFIISHFRHRWRWWRSDRPSCRGHVAGFIFQDSVKGERIATMATSRQYD